MQKHEMISIIKTMKTHMPMQQSWLLNHAHDTANMIFDIAGWRRTPEQAITVNEIADSLPDDFDNTSNIEIRRAKIRATLNYLIAEDAYFKNRDGEDAEEPRVYVLPHTYAAERRRYYF